ncbi:hypothetical protein [Zunongwangia endophytica]|uniref:Uncharacterized protein n=1 Tax=Zunongwangia endophytica TaxID=1808945 RepID=A0ABV8HET3_9FLAO|nr:hypothetical protein [Zunongwangia endophytica]MDN3593398.1 hypothetical protein [Zunongwangia endophytica]
METKEKKLDEFTQKIFKETDLETPTFDFTNKVMTDLPEIDFKVDHSEFQYKPLISKSGWTMIAALLLILVISPYYSSAVMASEEMMSNWDKFGSFFKPSFDSSNFSILNSEVFAISLALFATYFLLEILLLNKWMDKRA